MYNERWKFFPLQGRKSSQTSQNAVLETTSGEAVFIYIYWGLGQSRMVAGMPSFLKSDYGRDVQGTLSYLAF